MVKFLGRWALDAYKVSKNSSQLSFSPELSSKDRISWSDIHTGFLQIDARFLKFENMPNLLSEDKKRKYNLSAIGCLLSEILYLERKEAYMCN